ncbi:MAG TPA: heparan-alpha-glucosaminide N-acetyltransferase domain-containing protein [Acidobacteriaceae bacterium]|nr:heparan-alpha-glucosaminide N-acetyltransferase domain-containing protein [Acidobacteriaceae bacterium]
MSSATRTVSAPDSLTSSGLSSKRYLAVDLLRGLTIAFMILVNDNGSNRAFSALKHAEWNGFTPTDLVFPTFLFLVGVSIVLSTESRLARGVTRASLFAHTVRRAIIIYLLGLVVNSAPFFRLSTMRYYGVLPRIALCYLIVASLYIWIRRPAASPAGEPTVWDKVGLLVACLVGYWILMRFVPVPGFGLPGRDVPLLDHDGNLVAWLDRQIFSAKHLYEGTRDPEGLISTIPALGTTLIGVLTGLFLRSSTRSDSHKALGLAVAGVSGLILGQLWNPWFPINKKLWTSSYVFYAAGWSLLILAAFWFLVQVRKYTRGTWPLLVFGTNAIAAYVLSEVMSACLENVHVGAHSNVPHWTAQHIAALMPSYPALGSLAYSLLYVLVCWLIVLPLYRKKIFIKI